ncbi:hypothetical protein [Corallococcus llansteffanensis]|uniref:Lipoprotein n=1 Tax=Corallococcus llansteffanensis TaxID=2316731 RepID=A0A3A8PNM8_9BACT|nr:hypothetical protein [Corallococcus llansteffanensis]RKH56291.1 hypothetical protein D7V93_20535 [Corallococcus llansteffanensis]
MRKLWWWLPVTLVLSACRKDTVGGGPEAGTEGGETVARLEGEVAPDDGTAGPYPLTQAKLEAYVGYQRKMLEVYGSLMRGLQDMGPLMDAGTPQALEAARSGLRLIERKAQAETDARKAAGLTTDDVNRIAEIVTAVISQRQMGRTLQYEEELKKLEALQSRMPAEQQQELAPQVDSMRRQVEAFQKLPEARREFGDANVDVVLTREVDLTKNYQDMLKAFAGVRR